MTMTDMVLSNLPIEETKGDWNRMKCAVCNDYKLRAGVKIDNNHIIYNCFNCGAKAVHDCDDQRMNGNMRRILNSFSITNNMIDEELGKMFFINPDNIKRVVNIPGKDLSMITPEISLPAKSYRLVDDDDIWSLIAKEYLKSRHLGISDHPWYLSDDKTFRSRIIIPFYRNNKLIYWQGRSMDDTAKMRYINPEVKKTNIIFGYDKLNSKVKNVFITEGVFDAVSIDGVSLLGSALPIEKINILRRHERGKQYIFVIDKDRNGYKLGKKVLSLGWSITFLSGETDDANHAVSRFGKLWTINNLLDNIKTGFAAEVYLETICTK